MASSNSPSGDPVRDYVRANLHQITRDAIRAELVKAGHDPVRVDAVWEEEWNAARRAGAETSLSALALSLFFVGAVIGTLGALTVLGLAGTYDGRNKFNFLVTYAVLYAGIGLGIWWLVRWAARRGHVGGVGAALLGVLLVPVYGILMFGGCLAAAGIANRGG